MGREVGYDNDGAAGNTMMQAQRGIRSHQEVQQVRPPSCSVPSTMKEGGDGVRQERAAEASGQQGKKQGTDPISSVNWAGSCNFF